MFITFEGGEGCGKSTHVKLLAAYLKKNRKKVLLTHEPGGTKIGKNIRELLLHSSYALSPLSELMFLAIDRIEHVQKKIVPALAKGVIVISDRYYDSTTAYQIGGRGLPEDVVRYLNLLACGDVFPDLTILLDIDPKIGIKRAAKKGKPDKFEKEKPDFHRRVRGKYLAIARREPDRVKVVDSGKGSIKEVQEKIRRIIDEKF